MNRKYQIIISSADQYPFGSQYKDLSIFDVQVRIKFDVKNETWQTYYQKIRKIVELEGICPSFISLISICEDRINACFNLKYQHVPYSLGQFQELKMQMSSVELKVTRLCQFLIQHHIKPIYSMNNFGFDSNLQLKYLLLPNFTLIHDQNQLKNQKSQLSNNIKTIFKSYKSFTFISPRETFQEDKISQKRSERDLDAYNKKFQEKISLIENRLLLSKNGYFDKPNNQKIKKRKKFSHNFTDQSYSVSSNSQRSFNNIEINNYKIKIQNNSNKSVENGYEKNFSQTEGQRFYHKSYQHPSKQSSSNEEKQSPQDPIKQKDSKLTNSLIISQKGGDIQKLKHHKSSFGDYSNYGNESEKQLKLKRRITFALEKSQNALKVYEKYQSMRGQVVKVQKKS